LATGESAGYRAGGPGLDVGTGLQASVGFYFTDQAPTNTPFKIGLRSYDIAIPAGKSDYLLKDSYVLPVDVEALAVLPHAHYLAKQMAGFALLPDGTKRWLFLIKDWDFNWQGDYRYAQPLFLPKGSTLVMEYTYDNSTNNARNPAHPPRRVEYGLASTDEMGELWLQVLTYHTNDLAALEKDYGARVFHDAVAYNEYLLRLNTNDVTAHVELGKAKTAQGKPVEALKHLRIAARLQPDNEETHYFLGLLYQRQGKPNYARTEFEQILRLNPANFKAHTYLGLTFLDLGDLDRAEEQFRTALRLQPGDDVAQSNLDIVLRARAQQRNRK
jgi:Flp pilus assembly protein TadD